MGKWKNTTNHWSKTNKRKEVLDKVVKNLNVNYWKDKKHSQSTKDKISETKKGVSVWGGKRDNMYWLKGENNHNWKGGITEENQRIRNSLEHKAWAKEVYKKDNWSCRMCGKKCKKDIVAHHLELFSDYPELRFSVDNGITLCRSCHKKVHKSIGINTRFKKK